MLISVVQNSGFLSDARPTSASENWRVDARNKIEIDLLQENRNKSIKANCCDKTDSTIDRSSHDSRDEDKNW